MKTQRNLASCMRKCVWFAALLVASLSAMAQNLRQITTQDGLAGSAVTCVHQSDDGLIWAGTLDGINLYFGGKAVRPSMVHPFKGELIERIVETSSYDFWIQTTHGLHKVNRVTNEVNAFLQFTGLYTLRRVSHDHVAVIDSKSNLYLYHHSTGSFEQLNYPLAEGEQIVDMGGTEQFFWIVGNRGVHRCNWSHEGPDKTRLSQTVCLTDSPVKFSTVSENPEIIYLIDGHNRLCQLDIRKNEQTFILQLEGNVDERGQPSGIVESNGAYYISFKVGGAVKYVFNAAENVWKQTDLGIKSGVFQMIKDRHQELVWLATDGQGLFTSWEGSYTFQSYRLSELDHGLGKPVRALFVDEKGWLWMGTKGEGLLGIDRSGAPKDIHLCAKRRFTSSNSSLEDNSVYALSASALGGFWVGTDAGLNFFRYADRTLQPVEGGEEIVYVHSIREQDGSVLWVATVGAGVFKARIVKNGSRLRLEKVQHYEVDNGNHSSNYFFAMCQTSDGEMWFGNRGLGLFKMASEGLKALLPPSQQRTYLLDDVFALQEHNKVLWAGTGGGLLGLGADGREYEVNIENGLPNNIVRALQVDGNGWLWAATNNGLARLDSTYSHIKSYGRNNGLRVTEFSDGAAFGTKDKLYFGGMNGWVEVSPSPAPVPEKKYTAPLFFMTLKTANKDSHFFTTTLAQQKDGGRPVVELPRNENSLSLWFIAVDHVNPGSYRYLYKVDSDQKGNWIDNGPLSTLSLSQMLPGHYTLQLKYRNMHTGEESKPISIEVIISPYWWQTKAMMGVYWLLLIAGVAYLITRKYQKMKRKHQYTLTQMEQQHKEELYEEKLRFFTNITHEFSTPLTLIYSPCERILAYEGTDEFVRKYVQLIKKHTNRLYELIQEVIDYRRIETKHQQIHLERYNLSDFMHESCDVFWDWAEKHEVNFVREIEPDVYWNIDMRCIPNVVANLLSNAIKYTPCGGTLKCTLSKLSEQEVEIRVYNTGKGIKEEDRLRIFNRYSVLDNVEERAMAGIARNGLGMAICHSSVKLLGGTIDVNSEVGKYAEFVVKLPLLPLSEGEKPALVKDAIPLALQNVEVAKQQMEQQESDDVVIPVPGKDARKEPLPGGRPSVLVVDDNKDVLFLLSETLSHLYQVEVAQSADEALESLRRAVPQLIITDIMMPGKDGIQLTQQIKQNKHTMHVPLVILSAKSTEEAKTQGIQEGADAYISKPFNMQYLLAVVKRLIDSRKDMQQYYNSSACAYDYVEGQLLKREDKDFLHKLDEFVETHLSDNALTTEDIAEAMNLSVRSLYRRLKEMNLPSPKDYLKERKMEKVVKLLLTSDLSIQEIIFECGFNNRAHFYKDFSQRYGMTPKEFRKSQKSPDDSLGEN